MQGVTPPSSAGYEIYTIRLTVPKFCGAKNSGIGENCPSPNSDRLPQRNASVGERPTEAGCHFILLTNAAVIKAVHTHIISMLDGNGDDRIVGLQKTVSRSIKLIDVT